MQSKDFILASAIVGGLLCLVIWVTVASQALAFVAPQYPHAQQVSETKVNNLPHVSFSTNDNRDMIEQFYIRELTARGWEYNQCHDFLNHTSFWVAELNIMQGPGGTNLVTFNVFEGMLSCDMVLGR